MMKESPDEQKSAGGTGFPVTQSSYWAFITYSHADARIARRLHTSLERFRLPPGVAPAGDGGSRQRRLRPIFLDRAELAGSSNLPASIEEALSRSRALIVVCSPAAAASRWVNEEIRIFLRLGRGERIFPVIVDAGPAGRPADAFPAALTERVGTNGVVRTVEPLAADVRRGQDGYTDGVLKIIAGILDVGFDALKRRQQHADNVRKLVLTSALFAAVLVVTFVYLGVADAAGTVPASAEIRWFLDSHDASIFRWVPSDSALRAIAASKRTSLAPAVLTYLQSGQIISKTRDGRIGGTWELGQVATSIVRTPESTRAQLTIAKDAVSAIFVHGGPTEIAGRRYGWLRYDHDDETQAEASLWPAIALTALLARNAAFTAVQRATLTAQLAYAQSAASSYHSAKTGGWAHFADQQNPDHASLYTGTAALAALLGTQTLGLAWRDGDGHDVRERWLKSTVRYFISTYDRNEALPGWHNSFSDADPIEAGTLQIYALLLRGSDSGFFSLPRYMFDDIERRLAAMQQSNEGPFSVQPDALQEVVGTGSRSKEQRYVLKYLWYPAALQCSVAWLRHEEHVGAEHAKIVVARRRLNGLVLIADQVAKKKPDGVGFYGAETLMALDEIPAPKMP